MCFMWSHKKSQHSNNSVNYFLFPMSLKMITICTRTYTLYLRSLISHATHALTSLIVRKVFEKEYFSQPTSRNNLQCSEALHVGWFDNMVNEFLLILNYSVDSNLQHNTFTWTLTEGHHPTIMRKRTVAQQGKAYKHCNKLLTEAELGGKTRSKEAQMKGATKLQLQASWKCICWSHIKEQRNKQKDHISSH